MSILDRVKLWERNKFAGHKLSELTWEKQIGEPDLSRLFLLIDARNSK